MRGWSYSLTAALLLVLPALEGIVATKPSPGCGKAPKLVTANSTSTPLALTVNGKTRNYFVKLPDNYDNSHPYRLIYTLHALGGTASQCVKLCPCFHRFLGTELFGSLLREIGSSII
jgi:hypothetical protein